MSDVPTYTDEMPRPTPTNGPSMHDLVSEDLAERKAHGLRKYNCLLQAGNGRPALKDAYEEALDLVVYLRQELAEREDRQRETRRRRALYDHELWLEAGQRVVIRERSRDGDTWRDRMARVKYTTDDNGETVLMVFPDRPEPITPAVAGQGGVQ